MLPTTTSLLLDDDEKKKRRRRRRRRRRNHVIVIVVVVMVVVSLTFLLCIYAEIVQWLLNEDTVEYENIDVYIHIHLPSFFILFI